MIHSFAPNESFLSLDEYLEVVQDCLQTFAQTQGGNPELFSLAFGSGADGEALQQLLSDFGAGNFSGLPVVSSLSGEDLAGAKGVFVAELNQVYLSTDFLAHAAGDEILAVLLEEIGHAIDFSVNRVDSPGDEGAIFSAIVRGVELSEGQWQALKQENDTVEMVVNGQVFSAEAHEGDHAHPDDPLLSAEHQALMDLIPVGTATHTAVANGSWFAASTWAGGVIPAAGAIVHIPAGINVTYEGASDAPIFAVRVDGGLTFTATNGVNTKIVVDTLIATPGSSFNIDADAFNDGTVDVEIRPFDIQSHEASGATGWNSSAIAHFSDRAIVTDTGAGTRTASTYQSVDDGAGILGRYNWDPQQLSLGVVTHGSVRINGQEKLAKSAIAVTAMAGSISIQLEDSPTGWQVGDQIVITGTKYVPREARTGESQGSQDEIRTITQISGNTVTFDRALTYNHNTPRADLDAYVANLTRNIQFHSSTDISIEGILEADTVGDIASTLGHVMFMHNDDVQVRYAAFDDLGRTNKNDVLDDFQRQGFDGLDAERVRQNNNWVKTPANQITNMRGRYAVHLHRTGATATDSTALVEGSVVTGGPSWGFVSHDSRADFYDNVTYGVLGAGFMAETGNETGTWGRNIAINTYGADFSDATFDPRREFRYLTSSSDLTMILEKRGAWKNHDMGHFGNGFWFQGKLIDAIDNVSVSSGLDGYFFMFRAPDQINVDPDVLVEPLSVHSPNGIHPFAPGLNVFVGNESIADTRGLEMIGIGGGRTNDERSVIIDFTAWEVGDVGLGSQYYPGFTVRDSTFIGSTNPNANTADGILWRQTQVDTVLANLEIVGFNQQYDLRKQWSNGTFNQQGFANPYTVINEALANGEENPLPYAYAHILIDPGFTAAQAAQTQYMGTTYDPIYDQILRSSDLQIGRFNIQFDDSSLKINLDNKNIPYGTAPEDPVRPTLQEGHVLLLKGTKTDSIGTIPINYHNNVLVWMEDAVQHRLETVGYYLMPNGSLGVVLEELFSDRFTAAKHIVKFVAELDPRWNLARAINRGLFNPVEYADVYVPQFLLGNTTPPAINAVADSTAVDANSSNNLINVLANDTSFGSGLASITASQTTANGGTVSIVTQGTTDPSDDRLSYTPATNFSGTDTFAYTITDTAGNVDTATVTITVGTTDLLPDAVADSATVSINTVNNIVNVLANDTFGNGLAALTTASTSANGGTVTVDNRGTASPNDDVILYTPAANFSGTDTFTYTLTDVDGDTDTASVSITVNPAPAEGSLIRIAAGSGSFTDIYGQVWAADYGFQGGSTSYKAEPIAGTENDAIYYGKRYGQNISYDIALANGTYDVVIHMTEPRDDATVGSRVFDVFAESQLRLDNFDMYVAMGANAAPRTAVTATISSVTVTDGVLDLDFTTVAGRPVNFSGIEIFLSDGDEPPIDLLPNAIADVVTVPENSSANVINVLANDTFGDGLAALTTASTSANGGTVTVDNRGTASPNDDVILYTPAANFSGTDTFTYTIADVDGDVDTAAVSVTVNPVQAEDSLIRIAVGGNSFTDIYGQVWAADYGFQGGSTSYRAEPIAGTENDAIYYGKRYGENISYDITLANGTYDVVIHMTEPRNDATVGSRVFDVFAESQLRLDNFDMYVAMGANAAPRTAVTATISNLTVTDGVLDLDFTTVAGRPVNFSGIEIFAA